jgi:uncharacterized protein YebE (UPF0316 family)
MKEVKNKNILLLSGLILLLVVAVIGTLIVLSKLDEIGSSVTVVSEQSSGTVGVTIEKDPSAVGETSTDVASGEIELNVEER